MSDAQLIQQSDTQNPEDLLHAILDEFPGAPACLTCSFQAEDMIVLSLLRPWLPNVPVLFLETGYHFADTYRFRDQIARDWKLNLVNVAPQTTVPQQEAEFGILHQLDPAKCCQLRKVEPLMESLQPFELWFTGLRREQSPTRRSLKKIEHHKLPTGKSLLKISLLADWTWAQVWEYDRGYLSIGCEPCTAIPAPGADARSGRWGGKKLECGIHTFSEKTDE
jgi:phosphoadenosine phosphosulfate reductase